MRRRGGTYVPVPEAERVVLQESKVAPSQTNRDLTELPSRRQTNQRISSHHGHKGQAYDNQHEQALEAREPELCLSVVFDVKAVARDTNGETVKKEKKKRVRQRQRRAKPSKGPTYQSVIQTAGLTSGAQSEEELKRKEVQLQS